MSKNFLILFAMLFSFLTSSAQTDVITKHNGEIINGTVIRTTDFSIVFSYEKETSENTVSKYAVEKIVYGKSGRVEKVSEKIILNSEKDWEKVITLEDRSLTSGLKRVDEIRGKTAFVNFQTGNTGDKKALKKLKMQAAKMNCPFVLITSEMTTVGDSSNELGGSQSIKTAIAYKY